MKRDSIAAQRKLATSYLSVCVNAAIYYCILCSGFSMGANGTTSCRSSISGAVSSTYTFDGTATYELFDDVWAPAIHVKWKSLAEFSTVVATPTNGPPNTSAATPGGSLSPLPSNSSIPTTPEDNTNNHRATTIAIAVAVPIVLIAMSIVAFILFRNRRKSAAVPAETTFLPELDGEGHALQYCGPQIRQAPIELATDAAPGSEYNHFSAAAELQMNPVYPVRSSTSTPASSVAPSSTIQTLVNVSSTAPQYHNEIQRLQQERDRVHERRERLLKLEALDEEDRQLKLRIEEQMIAGRAEV